MKFLNILKGAILAIGLSAGSAYATSVDFEVGSDTDVTSTSFCGGCSLSIEQNPLLEGTMFSLAEGQTESLAFFDIVADVNTGIAGGWFDIDATLAFLLPGGSASSTGSGAFVSVFGAITGGILNWDQNEFFINFGNGGQYSVVFDQGVDVLKGTSKTIYADVTLTAAPIPLPASGLLLILGMGGLGVMRLRKRATAST